MSDRLDDDVLLLVLQELATFSPTYSGYLTGQHALYRVCLASHRLRRLAQPLLWRHIWVVKQSQADKLQSSPAAPSFGQYTSWYTVGKRESRTSLPDAVEMADLLPNVEKLLLWGPDTPGNLTRIASFTNLRHLSLVDSKLGGFSMLVTAPLLEELDLHGGFISYPGAAEWLKPRYLPALRILSVVVNEEEAVVVGRFELSEILGPAMLAQLDVIHTVQEHVELRSNLALGTAPAVLISDPDTYEDEDDDDAPLPRHSIFPFSTWSSLPPATDGTLFRIAGQVEDSLTSPVAGGPRVIVLPRWVLSLSTRDQDVGYAVQRLEEASGDAVRIIWSGDEGLSLGFGGVSREFVAYARELKAARLAQEAEGPRT